MHKWLRRIFYLIAVLFISACDRGPKPIVITYQMAHQADTLFHNQYSRIINKEIDSICQANKKIYYQRAVDSLLKIELEKMENLFQ